MASGRSSARSTTPTRASDTSITLTRCDASRRGTAFQGRWLSKIQFGRQLRPGAFIGSADTVAQKMADWFEARAVDGFNIYIGHPEQFNRFTSEVIPLLQERGVYRRAYEVRPCGRTWVWRFLDSGASGSHRIEYQAAGSVQRAEPDTRLFPQDVTAVTCSCLPCDTPRPGLQILT